MPLKAILLLPLFCLLVACQPTEKPAVSPSETTSVQSEGVAADLAGYELTDSPANDWRLAEKTDETGEIINSGFVDAQGLKQGSWTSWEGTRSPSRIENYVDGQLHGAWIEFDAVGRLRKIAHYKMGKLDGRYAEFRAAIPQITATYRDGDLHGTFRAHTLQNGKVNRSIEYRNGQQDGPMRWYNDNEELIQERMYKNGELVE